MAGPIIVSDNKMWSDDETIILLDVWGSDEMQLKLTTIKRNRLIWEEVASMMLLRGYHRSAKQCCGKIHNLKVEFRKVKTLKKENNFKFFDVMEPIMIDDITLANNADRSTDQQFEYRSPSVSIIDPPDQLDRTIKEIDDGGPRLVIANFEEPTIHLQSPNFIQEELRSVKIDPDQSNIIIDIDPGVDPQPYAAPTVTTTTPTIEKIADISTNRSKKRRHESSTMNIDLVLEKLTEMQEASDRRFYEWEEKRLRLEKEYDERRQRLEAERESRRENFLIQLVSMLQSNGKTGQSNR